jgi:demethylmenaquinone methyltransferase / 2-methoxy-6-polyprenyl-1,4-benzoquinol methylase
MTEHISTDSSSRSLHRIFTAVPGKYDLINHVITLGMDVKWRSKAARTCLSLHPARVLDLCCGTGDLAFSIAQQAEYNIEITGVDYSQPMLDIAAEKSAALCPGKNIKFISANVSKLPFPDNYFDCVGISFAFRNITYRNPLAQLHIKEVLRVLKPCGQYIIVESSQPQSPVIRFFYRLYLCCFVFPAGSVISGNKAAYRYLAESAAHFYTAEEARDFLIASGFREVSFQRLFFGAASIHSAVK